LTRIRHGDSRHHNRNAQYLVGPSSKDFQALRQKLAGLAVAEADKDNVFIQERGGHSATELQSGTVKVYAIGSAERNPTMPTVPTTLEGGLPEFQTAVWYALFAPKGTPRPILNTLTEALDMALNDQDVRRRLLELGFDIPGDEKRGQQPLAALAGGTTGSIRAMRAKPDGYTIQMGHIGTHAFSVALYPNLAYKPDVDFEPIGVVVEQYLVIAARKDFPPKDLKEFGAYVKANAKTLNMAHAGVGSGTFTFGLLLNSVLGAKPTTIPFNGNAPAMNALVGGQVDYMLATISEVGPQLRLRSR
jgi:tripartite-type tricarboxylate transporter receptor subunit TctC